MRRERLPSRIQFDGSGNAVDESPGRGARGVALARTRVRRALPPNRVIASLMSAEGQAPTSQSCSRLTDGGLRWSVWIAAAT